MNSEATSINPPAKAARPRPLSPHLQVYRWLISNTLSILHRLTGVALSFGLLLVVAWIIITAYYPGYYEDFTNFLGSPVGYILLGGWSVALFYHFCNGIRHLFWDMGKGFALENATRSGIAVLIATVVLTALAWLKGLGNI